MQSTPNTLFSCDYEISVIKEFLKVFPAATVAGCLFHFSQNILKHIRLCNLIILYEDDHIINLHVRMITALAFVPVADVPSVFEDLQERVNPRLDDVMDYV